MLQNQEWYILRRRGIYQSWNKYICCRSSIKYIPRPWRKYIQNTRHKVYTICRTRNGIYYDDPE